MYSRIKHSFFFILIAFTATSLSSCSNSTQEDGATDETTVINEEDYLRNAVNSLDAYKIACFAVLNNEWIFALQKWKEGDVLSEQEGRLPAVGLTQAMEVRLQKGQGAEWNGKPAEETINGACSRIRDK